MTNKYYNFGYAQATGSSNMTYWEAGAEFGKTFYSELKGKRGTWQSCSWEDGWNAGRATLYKKQLEKDMNSIKAHKKFTDHELDVLKRFFTDDLQQQINEIKRVI